MDVIIRRVFKHGKSYTFTIPWKWEAPEVFNVYSNSIYFVYSPLKGLETTLKATYVKQVKKRVAVSRRYRYYLLTIPIEVAERVGIEAGSELLVFRALILDHPAIICVTRDDIYKRATLNLVKGEIPWGR